MRQTWLRVALVYIAGAYALVGVWATFFPHAFYADFPGGGRNWVAMDGPFNEHLVRDVGELNLALLVVALAAAVTVSMPLVRAALGATVVNGALHVVYHARHLSDYETGDQVAMMGSLVIAPLVAAMVLLVVSRNRPAAKPSASGT